MLSKSSIALISRSPGLLSLARTLSFGPVAGLANRAASTTVSVSTESVLVKEAAEDLDDGICIPCQESVEAGESMDKDEEEAAEVVRQTGDLSPQRIADAIGQARCEIALPVFEDLRDHLGEGIMGGGASLIASAAAHIDAMKGPEEVGAALDQLSSRTLEDVAHEAARILTKRREEGKVQCPYRPRPGRGSATAGAGTGAGEIGGKGLGL